jgi:serine/threonine protein kinase
MPSDRDLFQSALDITDPAARAQYLNANVPDAEQRARVQRLLAAHDAAGGFLEQPPEDMHLTCSAADLASTRTVSPNTAEHGEPSVEQAGEFIAGKYKLLQQIGEGGMGSVWMADQTEPVRRRVAVKLIRVDRGSSKTILSRFEAERQAIALMDHPHIAKLFDAGTTDVGQPYFVMELVKGVPLTDYCDAHKLSIPDRLNLFMQICSAV